MCSDSTGTGGQSSDWRSTMSCHQWSRPATMWTPSPEALDDDRRLDGRRVGERLVGMVLEPDLLAAPVAAVGGDQDLGAAVVDPPRQRLGREPAEDDRVGRPDPGAGEHRDRQLRDHRHVDRDPVAGLDAQLLERVGRLADLALEVAEGQRPGVARLADPVVGDLVAEAALDVAVDAVVADVQLAAGEPLGERELPLEGRLERLGPVEPLARALRPERLEVAAPPPRTDRPSRWPGRRRRGRAGRSATRRAGSRSRATGRTARRSTEPSHSVSLAGPSYRAGRRRATVRERRRPTRSPRRARPGRAPSPTSRPPSRGSRARTTRCGRGISIPFGLNATSSRLRKSPAAAHWSAARTVPRILSVTPYSARAATRSTRGASRTRRFQSRVAGHLGARPCRPRRWPCRCRSRRRP